MLTGALAPSWPRRGGDPGGPDEHWRGRPSPWPGGLDIEGAVTFGGNVQVNGDATVTGDVTAAAFAGDGSAVTDIDAANITTNRLDRRRLPAGTVVDVEYLPPVDPRPTTTSSSYVSTGYEISLTLDRTENAILFESQGIGAGSSTGGGANRNCQLRLRETVSDTVLWEGSSGDRNSHFPTLQGEFPFSMTGLHTFLFEFRLSGGTIGFCQFGAPVGLVLFEIAG